MAAAAVPMGSSVHGIHYGVLAIGLVGVCALLLSRLLQARRAPTSPWRSEPAVPLAQRLVVPVAFASSAAAAGVHAAVAPVHFRDGALLGAFFATAALLQLLWAGAVALRCTRALLVAGLVGNLVVLAIWAASRTVGLPFGLHPDPEPVGSWDLACALWESVVIASCVALLRRSASPGVYGERLAAWRDWQPLVRIYVVGSVLLLGALSFSGAAA